MIFVSIVLDLQRISLRGGQGDTLTSTGVVEKGAGEESS